MGKRMEKVKTAADKTADYGTKAAKIFTTIVTVATLTKEVINTVASQKKK